MPMLTAASACTHPVVRITKLAAIVPTAAAASARVWVSATRRLRFSPRSRASTALFARLPANPTSATMSIPGADTGCRTRKRWTASRRGDRGSSRAPEIYDRSSAPSLRLRAEPERRDLGMPGEMGGHRLAQRARPLAVDDRDPVEAGEGGVIEVFVQFLNGLLR